MTSITIPNSVTNIGDNAFYNCTGLTSVIIGNSVTSIGYGVFSGCSSLTDVYCYADNVPNADYWAFRNSSIASATLHVPSVKAYSTTAPWSGFGTILPIYDEESSKPFPAGTYAKVDLKRTFVEGWNTICLPFETYESDFGEGAKVYKFTGFENGKLKFNRLYSREALEAGTPYVIYMPAEKSGIIPFSRNYGTYAVVENSSSIEKNGVYFRGTYAPVAPGAWTKNNSTDDIYGLTADGRIRKAGDGASILGFRAYFDIPTGTAVKGFIFEDGATGIETIDHSSLTIDHPIYNVAGQRLNKAQKGINIINGKKILK